MMNWDAVSALSEVFGVIFVVASLIFVGFQMRQTSNAIKVSAAQGYSTGDLQLRAMMIESGEVAHIWRVGLSDFDSLTEDERVRFILILASYMRIHEAAFSQRQRGQLDPENWTHVEQSTAATVPQPGFQAFWKLRRHWYTPEYQQWIDSLPSDPGPLLY